MFPLGTLLASSLAGLARNITNPLPSSCDYNTSEVVFINQKALNVLPYYFTRDYLCMQKLLAEIFLFYY